MISSESKKGKILHIEFLRFFCIWLVMFTHTSTAGFSLYLLRPESFSPLLIIFIFTTDLIYHSLDTSLNFLH